MDEATTAADGAVKLRQVADMFDELGRQLKSSDAKSPFEALVSVSARSVPGASASTATMSSHAAAVVAAHLNSQRAANLEKALHTSREIGTAVGVLMAAHKLTREQAFDLLRIASQRSNRKIRDLAVEVADTGALPHLPTSR